jgi:hypothetical protein
MITYNVLQFCNDKNSTGINIPVEEILQGEQKQLGKKMNGMVKYTQTSKMLLKHGVRV